MKSNQFRMVVDAGRVGARECWYGVKHCGEHVPLSRAEALALWRDLVGAPYPITMQEVKTKLKAKARREGKE